jgi:DNA-directed RNA polymerase specialized sigma24 family protein
MNVLQHGAWVTVWENARRFEDFRDFKAWVESESGGMALSWVLTQRDLEGLTDEQAAEAASKRTREDLDAYLTSVRPTD